MVNNRCKDNAFFASAKQFSYFFALIEHFFSLAREAQASPSRAGCQAVGRKEGGLLCVVPGRRSSDGAAALLSRVRVRVRTRERIPRTRK